MTADLLVFWWKFAAAAAAAMTAFSFCALSCICRMKGLFCMYRNSSLVQKYSLTGTKVQILAFLREYLLTGIKVQIRTYLVRRT